MLALLFISSLFVAAAQDISSLSGSDVTAVTVPLSLGIGLFGSIFSVVGLCLCAGFWRRRLIRKQLMGADGIVTTTGTITSKDSKTNHHGEGGATTTYLVSYNFTASVDGKTTQISVSNSIVDGGAWQRFAPPCAATVRFLEREPRRCVLQDSAEIEMRQTCSLAFITCVSSVFILVGAAISLGVSLGLGVDPAAKVAGAVIFVVLIGAVLVLVGRALSMNVHAVICCLSGIPCCTEFSNITVEASLQPQVVVKPAQPVVAHAVVITVSTEEQSAVAMAQPVVAHAEPMTSPV